MTTASIESKPSFLDRFQKLGSNLFLGFLVTVLSVFTAATNYATYQVSGTSAGYEIEGSKSLANSNTEYIRATQFIIQDYTLYDSYYVQQGLDDFASEYYQTNFSLELQASLDRESAFDDQYYNEMYSYSNDLFNQAFDEFDKANAVSEKEAAYQLAMLIAAVGLAFAAYASLLDEKNHLRALFALMSLVMMGLSVTQFLVA
jgi:hypothetical protein